MYNKSEIMTTAWSKFRTGWYLTFSDALSQAWREAKANLGTIGVAELTAGDMVTIEYGDYGNFVTCTITDIADELFLGECYSVKAISTNGMNMEFCFDQDRRFRNVEKAVTVKVAA